MRCLFAVCLSVGVAIVEMVVCGFGWLLWFACGCRYICLAVGVLWVYC